MTTSRRGATGPALDRDAQVLVVGAGPIGLSLALELGLRGISVVAAEERSREGAQPRAKTTNTPTMQHMRRWGVAERLRDAAPLPRDFPTDVIFATKLFGRKLAHFENAFAGAKVRDARFPEPMQWVPQYTVEAVLRERLEGLPNVVLMGGHRFESLEQSADRVSTTVAEIATGQRRVLRSDYVVGADGARSRVREAIGSRMEGDHAFAMNYNLIVRIPELAVRPPAERAIMYWIVNPVSPCVVTPVSPDLWGFGILLPPGVPELSNGEIMRRIDLALGKHVEAEIVTADLWAAHRLIASKYREHRVFLAGDVCHLHPPYGGYGMHVGVADAVDLGWKLAATLDGWGGPGLLDSYQAERRPLHIRTIAEAVANYSVLSDHLIKAGLEDDTLKGEQAREQLGREIQATKSREFRTLGVVLGSCYSGSPIIVDDGTAAPSEDHAHFEPSAHPGCLAPHAWLADGSSLYDHFGTGYTLLQLGSASGRVEEFCSAAAGRGLPLTVLDVRDAGLERLYQAAFALVRPDHHVAWRGAAPDAGLLDTVMGGRGESGCDARVAAA